MQLRAYKYRVYPDTTQREALARMFGCCRFVYNWSIERQEKQYREHGGMPSFIDMRNAVVTELKQNPEYAWLNDVSAHALQGAVWNVHRAYVNLRAGRAHRPKFKSKHRSRQSAVFSFGYAASVHDEDAKRRLYLTKIPGSLSLTHGGRRWPEDAKLKYVTMSLDPAGRYWASVTVEDQRDLSLAGVETRVGVDVGLTSLITLSTGEKVANPKHEKRDRQRLAQAQRAHARKEKGSKNQEKSRLKVARTYARISDRRRDHLHKLTTRLVRENQAIYVEKLNVQGMVRNRALARAISDASWSELIRQLEYKCEWYGREFGQVDRWFPSSQLCSACGARRLTRLTLTEREWNCPTCGAHHDRDVNAARNILAEGSSASACGETVRPKGAKRSRARLAEARSVT
jgi:putative transposase